MSQEKLLAYEAEFDALVQQLPLVGIPVRATLTALHLTLDSLFNGSRANATLAPRLDAANSAAARLSYLIPVLMRAPREPVGKNALDATEAAQEADPEGIQRMLLLSYGHFCEVMPEVHRNYFSVTGDTASGFTLEHRTPEFGQHEALDIMLNELALASSVNPAADLERDRFDELAALAPHANLDAIIEVLQSFVQHHRTFLNESAVLTEEGYRAALGVGRREFERFRIALFAIADWCKGMASGLGRRLRREGHSDAVGQELLEWISVHWKKDFLLGLVSSIAGLSPAVTERLLGFLTVDFRPGQSSARNAGDGFLPPLARFADSYLFNPDLLKLFLPARNFLFALNRVDRKRFDDLVSEHLEPQLIADAMTLFQQFQDLVVVLNHTWKGGEIDLLVYSPAENAVLHVQGKAVIAPQGARMVQAVEARIQEGIEQLRRFRALEQQEKDEIVSQAVQAEVQGVRVTDALLSRSCFGTTHIWSQLQEIVPLNLELLASVTRQCLEQGKPLSLRDLGTQVWREIQRLAPLARPAWSMEEFPAGRTMIRLPMLAFDTKAVWREQWRTPREKADV